MNTFKILVLLICSNLIAAVPAAPAPAISIVLSGDFGRTHSVKLNGQKIPGTRLLDALTAVMKDSTVPVVVLMPENSRFSDWEELIVILSKVGFSNVRYFFFSQNTMKMTELKLSHMPQEFSLNPPPRPDEHVSNLLRP